MKTKIRNWIKNWFLLYDIKDLTIGGHCGRCGKRLPNKIFLKIWPYGVCENHNHINQKKEGLK